MSDPKAIYYAHDVADKLKELARTGFARSGYSTGFDGLDELMLIQPGHLITVTGIPSMGKSEVIDAILVNMSVLNDNWVNIMYSPENYPLEQHCKKLAEKYIGVPLGRMSTQQINSALMWIEDHFVWISPENTTIDGLIEACETVRKTRGCNVMVIDPWNTVDPSPQGGRREDQYIADCLRKLHKYCRPNKIIPIVIAHPTKMTQDDNGNYKVPKAYDINGGSQWYNQSSYILVIHRQNPLVNEVSLFVQKVKYKTMGKIGVVQMDYDYPSGRLKDKGKLSFTLPEVLNAPF